jgi:hypothetical protein
MVDGALRSTTARHEPQASHRDQSRRDDGVNAVIRQRPEDVHDWKAARLRRHILRAARALKRLRSGTPEERAKRVAALKAYYRDTRPIS